MSKDIDRQMRHCLPAEAGHVIVARMLAACTPAPAEEEDVKDGTATPPDGYHAIVDGGWGDLPCRAIRRAVGRRVAGAVLGRTRGRNGTAGR
jgi:hypothetical protein